MNFIKRLVSFLALTTLTACSATGGIQNNGTANTDQPRVVAMVTHGAPGDTFWDQVRKGAQDAARHTNMELRYSSDPQAPLQANLIQSAIDAGVDGIAVTLPNPSALGPAAQAAVQRGIPTVGLNAGMDAYQDYQLQGFFGQSEREAGVQGGRRLAEAGAKHVLCVIHEQGNISQEDRCAGIEEGLGSEVELLYVNGQDLTSVQATLEAKLGQDRSIDWIVTLQASVAMRAAAVRGAAKVGTFDTNPELLDALANGEIEWAIDQQPYVQGYMAIQALWLASHNGSTIGGGHPVFTGPSFIEAGSR